MKELIISNCWECPFCNNDNEFGRDGCNLNKDIYVPMWDTLPDDKRHDECPLNDGKVVVKAKTNKD